jgi:hypothetical protein
VDKGARGSGEQLVCPMKPLPLIVMPGSTRSRERFVTPQKQSLWSLAGPSFGTVELFHLGPELAVNFKECSDPNVPCDQSRKRH